MVGLGTWLDRRVELRARSVAMLSLALMCAMTAIGMAAPGAVVVGGAAPEPQRALVTNAVVSASGELGWSPPTALSKADATTLLGCGDSTTPWTCVPASFASRAIYRVMVVTVDTKPGDGGVPVVVLVGRLITTNPESSVVRQRFCEGCADDRLTSEARELAVQILREHAVRHGRTMVEIRSEPPGAAISLDGEQVGATNGSFRTFPGTHRITVEKPGFAPEAREVTVDENQTAQLSVPLRRVGDASGAMPVDGPPRRSRLLPAIMIGGGVVAVGLGIALQVTKDGPPLGEDQPARLYSAGGLGLVAAGAALTGVGVWLWLRATNSPRASTAVSASRSPGSTSMPVLRVIDGGGVLGWSGQF